MDWAVIKSFWAEESKVLTWVVFKELIMKSIQDRNLMGWVNEQFVYKERFLEGWMQKSYFYKRNYNHFWKLKANICSPPCSSLYVYAKDKVSETYNKGIWPRPECGHLEDALRFEGQDLNDKCSRQNNMCQRPEVKGSTVCLKNWKKTNEARDVDTQEPIYAVHCRSCYDLVCCLRSSGNQRRVFKRRAIMIRFGVWKDHWILGKECILRVTKVGAEGQFK